MESWKDFIRRALSAIAMGKIHNPHLAQRVDALLIRALDVFLRDPEIITRYNRAFEMGWRSPEWQQIPTLPDFIKFCTRERLNLRSSDPEPSGRIVSFTVRESDRASQYFLT
jgi:hypothetical protein